MGVYAYACPPPRPTTLPEFTPTKLDVHPQEIMIDVPGKLRVDAGELIKPLLELYQRILLIDGDRKTLAEVGKEISKLIQEVMQVK